MSGHRKHSDRKLTSVVTKRKPDYEAPLVVELGDVARARGAACKPGSSPTAHCGSGLAAASCTIGSAP